MKILKVLLKVVLVIVLAIALLIAGYIIIAACNRETVKSRIAQSDVAYVVIDETKTQISNEDLNALKTAFSDVSGGGIGDGEPICGFDESYAVEFVDTQKGKRIIVCPAMDKCPLFKVNEVLYGFSKKAREDFEATVKKYGLTFPNI